MFVNSNICLATDSYKVSHWLQFPQGMNRSHYYIESRGGVYDEVMVAGVKYLTSILKRGVTKKQVLKAQRYWNLHFGQDLFNIDGWMRIVDELGGKLPVRIRAAKEGDVIPVKNVLFTIESTVDGFGWLPGYLETMLLRGLWYPTTTATISFKAKRFIKEYLDMSTDLVGDAYDMALKTRLHDFGARGVSSAESAGIGGMGHLYNFMGTDTIEATLLVEFLYGVEMSGISIPAREHSTTTCYLRDGEDEAFMNSIENFGGGVFAIVIDSYSTDDALRRILDPSGALHKALREKGGVCVLRPDSGEPIDMVMKCMNAVWNTVGGEVNSKGYKVLDSQYRVIQGDGVDGPAIERILNWMVGVKKFSAENLAFGMGGGLLQHCDRDTQKFAMKCSAMEVDGVWRDVFKAPETDPSKKSKAGRLDLVYRGGKYETVVLGDTDVRHPSSALRTVFEDGQVFEENFRTFQDIRMASDSYA
ncbi:nicotinamide phosphoribosyltransferase [Vibrio phage VspSw_1]|uniref:Nicotinamide phosphoribosyltransferase n=1 Tax=Vibrio phage VspSw_1 TaxID=2484249 RepID=A0A411BKJ2_9CAUD|nr:nicotinamide phosphoribosyl transferase [Vibrio phage VspSw_1]QAY02160.1 nicotinamide phosphoribosyltransferase [Vibrio phage VspSw_1]